MRIIYEDKHLLLCEKPVGVESQVSSNKNQDMMSLLSEYRVQKGEDEYVGLVHRLDTATGGVIMYSKDKSLVGKLSELVAKKEYKKTYIAVISGVPETPEGEMQDLLFHDKQKNKTYIVKKERRGVKNAQLRYKLIETALLPSDEVVSLVEIELITGRTHQIRAQFSHRQMPLLGDGKYGSREKGCICALWSYKAGFEHPVTHKSICATSYPPKEYPWCLFNFLYQLE